MISHELTQRNVWPYLIGLSLILLAFLVGWMANEAVQRSNLALNLGNAPALGTSTEIHPADRKFFTNDYAFESSASAGVGSLLNVDPADRKFYTNNYEASGYLLEGVESLSDVDPADRKFYTQ